MYAQGAGIQAAVVSVPISSWYAPDEPDAALLATALDLYGSGCRPDGSVGILPTAHALHVGRFSCVHSAGRTEKHSGLQRRTDTGLLPSQERRSNRNAIY